MPHPTHRSRYPQVISIVAVIKHRCRQILTSREEILAILELRTWKSPVPPTTVNMATRAMQDPIGQWYAIWYAHGNEGIAFFVFLWACCHDIAVAIHVLMVDAKS